MNTITLESFLDKTAALSVVLDRFVEEQRVVASAVRARNWLDLEESLKRSYATAEMATVAEQERVAAWETLVTDLGLPSDSSVFRVSLALPLAARSPLTDAYRLLRLSAMRARIENGALDSFVGTAESTLARTIEELFPGRKGRVYGKSGKTRAVGSDALVLDAAF